MEPWGKDGENHPAVSSSGSFQRLQHQLVACREIGRTVFFFFLSSSTPARYSSPMVRHTSVHTPTGSSVPSQHSGSDRKVEWTMLRRSQLSKAEEGREEMDEPQIPSPTRLERMEAGI